MCHDPDGIWKRADEMETSLLNTRRLTIRHFDSEDWNDVLSLALDWRAAPGPEFDKWPTSEHEVRDLTSYFAGNPETYFAVEDRKNSTVVGLLALNGVDDTDELDLGHVILAQYQDDDHDREALGAMIDQVFGSMGINMIVTHNADYPPQLAPLKSLGFSSRASEDPSELVLPRERWARMKGS